MVQQFYMDGPSPVEHRAHKSTCEELPHNIHNHIKTQSTRPCSGLLYFTEKLPEITGLTTTQGKLIPDYLRHKRQFANQMTFNTNCSATVKNATNLKTWKLD